MERWVTRFRKVCFYLKNVFIIRKIGYGVFMFGPYRIDGGQNIRLGKGTVFQRGAWLYSVATSGTKASLSIGQGCVFGYNNHIAAVGEMVFGDYVLTANNVYISDNLHEYEDITRPILHQPVRFKAPVSIGSGSWIGENVSIISASIGKNCVIGANSVVTSDVPDYSVAVGAPARVIKQYNLKTRKWQKVDSVSKRAGKK